VVGDKGEWEEPGVVMRSRGGERRAESSREEMRRAEMR